MHEPTGAVTHDRGSEPDVSDVLSAFQLLLLHNHRIANLIADSWGIGPTDLRAIIFVAQSEQATPKSLADFLELTTGAVTSLVDRMEAAHYAERRSHPTDRRSVVLRLAPAGEAAMVRYRDFYSVALRDALDPSEFESMAKSLRAIGDSLTREAEVRVQAAARTAASEDRR